MWRGPDLTFTSTNKNEPIRDHGWGRCRAPGAPWIHPRGPYMNCTRLGSRLRFNVCVGDKCVQGVLFIQTLRNVLFAGYNTKYRLK